MSSPTAYVRTVAVAALLCTATRLDAAPVTVYTDLAIWEAAVGASSCEDFSSAVVTLAPPGIWSNVDGLETDGVSIRGTRYASIDDGAFSDIVQRGPGWGGSEDSAMFRFSPDIVGFGADWTDAASFAGLGLYVGMADGTGDVVTLSAPGGSYSGFWGFVATGPIEYPIPITISGAVSGGAYAMDNARYATTAVPEPATVALMLLGLFTVLGGRWGVRFRRS